MSCYGVDTAAIDRFAASIEDLPPSVLDLEPEGLPSFAKQHEHLLRALEDQFVSALEVFLNVTLAICVRQLALEREEAKSRAIPPRDYLQPMLALYSSSAATALFRLRGLLREIFAEDPTVRVVLMANAYSSSIGPELQAFTLNVPTASSSAEAEDHASSAKVVVDSIKKVIEEFLVRVHFGPFGFKKDHVKNGLHVLNEVLGMVTKGHL